MVVGYETKINRTKINQTKINQTKANRGRNPTNSDIRSREWLMHDWYVIDAIDWRGCGPLCGASLEIRDGGGGGSSLISTVAKRAAKAAGASLSIDVGNRSRGMCCTWKGWILICDFWICWECVGQGNEAKRNQTTTPSLGVEIYPWLILLMQTTT